MASVLDILPDSGASFGTTSPQEDAGRPLGLVDKILAAFGHSVANGVMAPGRALASKQPITSDQMVAPAMDLTSMLTLGAGAAPSEANSLRMGIKAYHSSPHDFDKFDLSKIGTGEGAQAYGHGLYFAESPAVSGQGGQYWNDFLRTFNGPERGAADKLRAAKFDREAAVNDSAWNIGQIKDYLTHGNFPETAKYGSTRAHYEDLLRQRQAEHELLSSDKPVGPRTYEVNINADPAHFLDWDKPLSQQSEAVQQVLRQHGVDPEYASLGQAFNKIGNYPEVASRERDQLVQQKLNSAGIPGIKYLDQGSRTASGTPRSQLENRISVLRDDIARLERDGGGQPDRLREQLAGMESQLAAAPKPSSNYVVFNDKLIDIMRKYGLAGMLGGAGLSQMPQDQQ